MRVDTREAARCNARVPAARSVALLLLAACSSAPDAVDWRPAKPRANAVLDVESDSPNVLSAMSPGTRIQLVDLPRSSHGIPLPDGSFLPALNGVPRSGPVDRPSAYGPLQPVVGVVVDEKRLEWYEHQDGSMTTSRYVWSRERRRWEPMTFHAVAAPKRK
jgi:hypothetical protein